MKVAKKWINTIVALDISFSFQGPGMRGRSVLTLLVMSGSTIMGSRVGRLCWISLLMGHYVLTLEVRYVNSDTKLGQSIS